MDEKWVLETKRADFKQLGEDLNISPVLARLLVNRGYHSIEEMKRYLECNLSMLHDGRLMKDMDKAVFLLTKAILDEEKIAIGTDFDNDGIISGYTIHRAIHRVGGEAYLYAPDRVSEGYGLNRRIVDDAMKAGCRILVTCDNGIAAFDAITYAKSLEMTVIVTDHHEVAFEEDSEGLRHYILPAADAIVNPKQQACPYPFKGLCGAGIVFKLITLLYQEFGIPCEEAYDLLEYTAIATVADVMDLVDENRIIVKYGLDRLRKTKNIGLRALMQECSVQMERVSAYHIGYIIGPCFNAAGRLDTVAMAFDLLQSSQEEEAKVYAKNLRDLNEERKEQTQQGLHQAIDIVETTKIKEDKVLLVKLKDTHESLVGIIAGRLREQYHKPSIVCVETSHGMKGSGRSIEAYHMFEELLKCKDLLSKFGGHPMAAGLSFPNENFEELKKRLNENSSLSQEDFIPKIRIDVPLPIGYLDFSFMKELERLEPFGKGNVKPVFAEQHFNVQQAKIIGKNQNMLKLKLTNLEGSIIDALYFGNIEKFLAFVDSEFGEEESRKMFFGKQNSIDLAFTYYPTINDYMGKQNIQIIIQNYCRIKK